MLRIWAVVLTGWLALGIADQTPQVIFLLAGQSNMLGQGAVKDLPAVSASPSADVLTWQDGQWRPLTLAGDTFGPEISFTQTLSAAFPGQRIGIVKLAIGGTPIDRWSPDDDKSLYADLLMRLKAAQGAAPGARVGAMLWMQGERDARTMEAADEYGAKLRRLVLAMRKDVGREDLPFLCGHVNPPYPYAETVRRAQAALPKDVPGTVLVSTDALDKKADDLHYSTSGQIELGRRFAEAYIRLVRQSR